jgi:hypothetical protein
MSLFGISKPSASEPVTGESVLRKAVMSRISRGPQAAASLAHVIRVGVGALGEFSVGHGSFTPQTLDLLAKELFGANAGFDSVRNVLTRKVVEATPVCTAPPTPWPGSPPLPTYPMSGHTGPQPLTPEPAEKPAAAPPGWDTFRLS